MKKTVNINISGIAFTIDEDAYALLQNYLGTIKGYFQNSEGQDEIMTDIESRIAEMLHQKLTTEHQVISLNDINEVISIMGNPEDYLDEETKSQAFASQSNKIGEKRLYRDAEDNVLGGVCSGVGYYFGVPAIALRIAILISVFVFGTGVFLYLILWAIIPKARTTSEKLEMKGESVNINNIGRAVEDEMEDIKTKFNEQKQHWRAKKYHSRFEEIIHKIGNLVFQLLTGIFKFFGKIIGAGFLVLATLFIVALGYYLFSPGEAIISITSEGINTFSLREFLLLLVGSDFNLSLASFGIALFLGVPAVALMVGGIKLILRIKQSIKGLGIAFATLWIVGIALLIISGLNIGNNFKNNYELSEFIPITTTSDTLTIDVAPDVFDIDNKTKHRAHNNFLLKIDDEQIVFGNPELDIVKSMDDSVRVEVIKYSNGKSNKEAKTLAEDINYTFKIEGNTLKFDPYYSVSNAALYRGQEINVRVHLPEGKAVYLTDDSSRIIYDIKNTSNTLDERMTNKTWTMLSPGLTCIDCKGI